MPYTDIDEDDTDKQYCIQDVNNPSDTVFFWGDLFGDIVPYINRIYGIKSLSGDNNRLIADCFHTKIMVTTAVIINRGL